MIAHSLSTRSYTTCTSAESLYEPLDLLPLYHFSHFAILYQSLQEPIAFFLHCGIIMLQHRWGSYSVEQRSCLGDRQMRDKDDEEVEHRM